MRIYTMTQSNLLCVPTENTVEPHYVENIPFSLQQKLNIPKSITVRYYNGNVFIGVGCKGREIQGKSALKIIKVINGYNKANH